MRKLSRELTCGRTLRAACHALLLLVAACGSEPTNNATSFDNVTGDGSGAGDGAGDGQGQPATSDWCNALGVLRDTCQECHAAGADSPAPMPLESYADLIAPAVTDPSKKVYELVKLRIHDERRPMPEAPRTLSAEQLAILDGWIDSGAQAGADPTCSVSVDLPAQDDAGSAPQPQADAGTGEPDPQAEEWPADCDEVYTITANDNGQPHRVGAGVEEHPQFIFDAPWGNDEVQALAFRPITDNGKVIHHWILYENSGAIGGQFLVGWSPGKDGMRKYPDDIGVYMPSGSGALRLDTHYYNRGGAEDAFDASGLEICVTRTFREHTATTIAFSASATAPAGMRVENLRDCTVSTSGGAAYLIASSPHMHKLGVHAKLVRTRSGSELVLHDAPFSFENQLVKPLDRVELRTGDVVTTGCTYDNPTTTTVRFGQNTDDEMCFNFALYYPMGNLSCSGGFGF